MSNNQIDLACVFPLVGKINGLINIKMPSDIKELPSPLVPETSQETFLHMFKSKLKKNTKLYPVMFLMCYIFKYERQTSLFSNMTNWIMPRVKRLNTLLMTY